MIKLLLSILILSTGMMLQAQVSLTVNETTAGTLSTLLPQYQNDSVTNLTITGNINSNDISTINYMPHLAILDLSGATIVASQYNIANNLPENAFVWEEAPAWIGNGTLNSIKLPLNLKSIGNNAFYESSITTLNIPPSVDSIAQNAFFGCWITSITIPSSVKYIGLSAFLYYNGTITVNFSTPLPLIDSNTVFEGINKNACILYVPKGTIAAYKAASGWKSFRFILEQGTSDSLVSAIRTLALAIPIAQYIIDTTRTLVGDTVGLYPQTAYNTLNQQISLAQQADTLTTATIASITSANDELINAITTFKASLITQASTTVIPTITFSNKHYKIIGNTLLFDENDATVYNLRGIRLSAKGDRSISLPTGIYFVYTALGTDEIVIR
jgi:hypothetical protein